MALAASLDAPPRSDPPCFRVPGSLSFSLPHSDGDIINEILNQEPCVIGPGGIYSIAALLLYALVLVMSCKLPQDDPYAPCCKKRSAARNGGNDGGARTFVGSEKEAAGEDEEKPAQAPWLSEEKEKGENENEII